MISKRGNPNRTPYLAPASPNPKSNSISNSQSVGMALSSVSLSFLPNPNIQSPYRLHLPSFKPARVPFSTPSRRQTHRFSIQEGKPSNNTTSDVPTAKIDFNTQKPETASAAEEEEQGELEKPNSEIKELRREKSGGDDLWSGVGEEVREIEWPVFGRVLGTTGVVLAVIAGSSVVLLTVNAVLAELSDRLFAGKGVQDFFG